MCYHLSTYIIFKEDKSEYEPCEVKREHLQEDGNGLDRGLVLSELLCALLLVLELRLQLIQEAFLLGEVSLPKDIIRYSLLTRLQYTVCYKTMTKKAKEMHVGYIWCDIAYNSKCLIVYLFINKTYPELVAWTSQPHLDQGFYLDVTTSIVAYSCSSICSSRNFWVSPSSHYTNSAVSLHIKNLV